MKSTHQFRGEMRTLACVTAGLLAVMAMTSCSTDEPTPDPTPTPVPSPTPSETAAPSLDSIVSEYWITPLSCDEILDAMGLADLDAGTESARSAIEHLWPDEAADLASGMRACDFYLSDGQTQGFSVDVTLMTADASPGAIATFEQLVEVDWWFELPAVSTATTSVYCDTVEPVCIAFSTDGRWTVSAVVDDLSYPDFSEVVEPRMATIVPALEQLAASLDDPLPLWEPPTTPATWPSSCDDVQGRVGDRVAEVDEEFSRVTSNHRPQWGQGARRWPSTACAWSSTGSETTFIRVYTYPGVSSLVLSGVVAVQGDPIELDGVEAAFLSTPSDDGWAELWVVRDGTLFNISYAAPLSNAGASDSVATVLDLYEYFAEQLAD